MYRAVALKALRAGTPLDDEAGIAALAHEARIEFGEAGRRVLLDGEDVSAEVRTREVSAAASKVSAHPAVRREMVARQRELGREGGVVLDGRDIGTAVFPDAELKFFIDADPALRAARRQGELAAAGMASDVGAIEKEIRARDHADTTRADSPLTRAPDAVALDTTNLSPADVVEAMLVAVRARQGRGQ
jgi:cytidylate kinase